MCLSVLIIETIIVYHQIFFLAHEKIILLCNNMNQTTLFCAKFKVVKHRSAVQPQTKYYIHNIEITPCTFD